LLGLLCYNASLGDSHTFVLVYVPALYQSHCTGWEVGRVLSPYRYSYRIVSRRNNPRVVRSWFQYGAAPGLLMFSSHSLTQGQDEGRYCGHSCDHRGGQREVLFRGGLQRHRMEREVDCTRETKFAGNCRCASRATPTSNQLYLQNRRALANGSGQPGSFTVTQTIRGSKLRKTRSSIALQPNWTNPTTKWKVI
jgi:hypothetical protein